MSEQTERKIVKSWQALLMLAVGIAIIIVGLMVMKLNNRIVLAVDGVIMCLMAWCFGIPYDDLQKGIKDTITSMIVAILILLAVGVLVGTWMISGTVPVMIYYGMKGLAPNLFLPIVCILCTLMSVMAGTSWARWPPSASRAWAWPRAWACRCPPLRAPSAWAPSSATRCRPSATRPSSRRPSPTRR